MTEETTVVQLGSSYKFWISGVLVMTLATVCVWIGVGFASAI